ncbi:hypothetical protein [Pedobacter nyackensis]|uniref:hypothetical protein n=1 Tax=Pedobacter nyackensis TaxID=475255 RepID=UPI00292CFEF5|nr:hypothetical protein [Pedobacter nyackensis]
MNNIFNMQRFLWLFSKHTKENYKSYLMYTGLFVAILSVALGWVAYFGGLRNNEMQEVFFAFSLTFSGALFASLTFSNLGDKSNAISVLTLPVSTFERFLVAWIYSFVIFQIVFVVSFYAVDITVLNISNRYSTVPTKLLDITSEETKLYIVFLFFWFLHSVAFLGSIFFKKQHFTGTALVFFLALIILIVINQGLVALIIGDQVSVKLPFSHLFVQEGNSSYYIDTHTSMPFVLTLMLSVSAVCLWTAAYFKLKEKQV